MSFELSRKRYADLYGPTVDDAVRLGDTDLFAQIERDLGGRKLTEGEKMVVKFYLFSAGTIVAGEREVSCFPTNLA